MTIAAGFVATIDLEFRGCTTAHIDLWDYGQPLAIDDAGMSEALPPPAGAQRLRPDGQDPLGYGTRRHVL